MTNSEENMVIDEIVKTKDDDYKEKILEKIQFEYDKSKIIASFADNKRKIKYLDLLKSDSDKVRIILSMPENEWENYLDKIENGYEKAQIISKFSDNNKKYKYIGNLGQEYGDMLVIRSLPEEKKEYYIQTYNFMIPSNKCSLILTLPEEKQDKYILELTEHYSITSTISSIENDERKTNLLIKMASKLDDVDKERIVNSISEDDLKIKCLDYIKNEFIKYKIIAKLNDNNVKLEKLKDLNLKHQELVKISIKDGDFLKNNFLPENRKYENIGLPNDMTFGIEIESETFDGINSDLLQIGYISGKEATEEEQNKCKVWNIKTDNSLQNGVEIASEILTDNNEDVKKIYVVCNMLKKVGQKATERCGGHVHIGADYLKSKHAFENLYEICGNCEKILFLISNVKGEIPREKVQIFAKNISNKLNENIENGFIEISDEQSLDDFISQINIYMQNNEKSWDINARNFENEKNTIEFRFSNGTINPDVWIENVRLYGRIMEISEKLAEIENMPKTSENERLLELQKNIKKEGISETEKLECLLNLLFDEKEQDVYRKRYYFNLNKLNNVQNFENPFAKMKFETVDFSKHKKEEFGEVAKTRRDFSNIEIKENGEREK